MKEIEKHEVRRLNSLVVALEQEEPEDPEDPVLKVTENISNKDMGTPFYQAKFCRTTSERPLRICIHTTERKCNTPGRKNLLKCTEREKRHI